MLNFFKTRILNFKTRILNLVSSQSTSKKTPSKNEMSNNKPNSLLSTGDEQFLQQLEKTKQDFEKKHGSAIKANSAKPEVLNTNSNSSNAQDTSKSSNTSSSNTFVASSNSSAPISNNPKNTNVGYKRAPERQALLDKILSFAGILGIQDTIIIGLEQNFDQFWQECPITVSNLKKIDFDYLCEAYLALNPKKQKWMFAYVQDHFAQNQHSYVNQFSCFLTIWQNVQENFEQLLIEGNEIIKKQETELENQIFAAEFENLNQGDAVDEALAFMAGDAEDEIYQEALDQTKLAHQNADIKEKNPETPKLVVKQDNNEEENPLNEKYKDKIIALKREICVLLGEGKDVPDCLESIQRKVNWDPKLNEEEQKQALKKQFALLDGFRRATKTYTKQNLIAYVLDDKFSKPSM
ncbi:MAG: hypothetical protein JSS07_00215 [Proteobacteria bacterium]|nr:hypothetical protein [Pseudomonadota bacterium]